MTGDVRTDAETQPDPDDFWSEAAWDDRYREREHRWSGAPNAVVVAELEGLTPGTALDVGCGEGGDAVWLARQGWTVTGLELSGVAIERARHAASAADVAVELVHHDLVESELDRTFDLVTASFVHVRRDQRDVLFARLAEAVGPGGTLLVLGHDLSDLDGPVHRPHLAEAGWTADQVAGTLDDGWLVDTCAARPRTAVDHHDPAAGETTVHDAVLRAHRVG